jgi:putative transcriptional regulator
MAKKFESLQCKLILDSGTLAGSYFEKSVILICRHTESGAFGLILNRPAENGLGEVAQEQVSGSLGKTPLFMGGPVQPEVVTFLAQSQSTTLSEEALPNLVLTHSVEEVNTILENDKEALGAAPDVKKHIHAFMGYAGWSAGQLENEIKSGSWLIHPGSIAQVFHKKPETLWKSILRQKGGLYYLAADFPDEPDRN